MGEVQLAHSKKYQKPVFGVPGDLAETPGSVNHGATLVSAQALIGALDTAEVEERESHTNLLISPTDLVSQVRKHITKTGKGRFHKRNILRIQSKL